MVPRNSARASHPKARNGANWSKFLASTSFFTKSTRLPGFELETFGRNVACGSKNTTCLPETNEGTSVRWYTELNPTPNLPVLPICSRFTESPIELMDVKSLSRNVESLYTSNEGPWNCAKRSYANVSVPCERSSKHTFTTVAPASSCGGIARKHRTKTVTGEEGVRRVSRGTAEMRRARCVGVVRARRGAKGRRGAGGEKRGGPKA